MLHEFAVEPEVFTSWERFRYFDEKFGVEHGRLISDFPRKWKRRVFDACTNCREVERKRIEVLLQQERFHSKIVRFARREYDNALEWRINAEKQHGNKPFRAIIAIENPNNHDSVLVAELLSEQDPLFKVVRSKKIERTASKIVGAAEVLLVNSREILIVDPYFDPQEPRWWSVLKEIVKVSTTQKLSRFELHCQARIVGTVTHWQNDWGDKLSAIIPYGETLRIVSWEEKQPGERFHARYILTEKGGIGYDSGLDTGEPGDTTDVALLGQELYTQRWEDYQEYNAHGKKKETTFLKVDELCIRGRK